MLRAVIYVDGQNLRFKLDALSLKEKDVNWGALFASLLPPDHRLLRAYWYQAAKVAPWEWNSRHHGRLCPRDMNLDDFRERATAYYESERVRLETIHSQVYERIEREYDAIEFRYNGVLKVNPVEVWGDPESLKIGKRVGEKGVDVAMAVDLVRHADHYDTAIVVSGDFDFLPAIQAVKDRLRRVIIVSIMRGHPPHHQGQARRLTSLCDAQVDIWEGDLKDPNRFAR